MFYELAPEVAGHLGPGTIMDRSRVTTAVIAVEYQFDGWPDDELIEAFPCFIVTNRMKELIEGARASGCTFGPVTVTTSDQYEELEELEELRQPRELPSFSWLIINGTAQRDDFGISATGSLVVSERILQVLKRGRLDNCDITPLSSSR
jgi:hypothetical protein